MRNCVYEISNLGKQYSAGGSWAIRHIDLQIFEGEIFGLLGDNGAGKSTLVKQMVGLLKPTEGTAHFLNEDVGQSLVNVSLNVGYMPQKTNTLNQMSVGESLYYTAHLRGLSRHDAKAEVKKLLALWQMEGLEKANNTHLSGGQRRLLRLAVAMAGRPPVLILDEPTNDLDPIRRNLVWTVLRELNREAGTTIIFITHDAIEAEKIIQRVGIMRQGSLVAVGRPQELKQSVDRSLRLDLFFDHETPPFPPTPAKRILANDGHWRFLVDWEAAPEIMGNINLDEIDDFRLYSATLEDLYLHYAGAIDEN